MTLSELKELKNKYNASKDNSKKYYKFVSENKGDLLEIYGPDTEEYKSIILVPNKVEEAVISKDEGRRAINNYLLQQDEKLKGSGIKAVDQSAKEILKNQDDTAEKLKLVNKIISKDESLVENKIAADEADKLLKDMGISKKDTASLNLFAKDLQKSVDRSNRIRNKWAKYPKALKLGASFLVPRMADKWEQGYDPNITDMGLDAGELALGPIIGAASKGIKSIPKALEFAKNAAKLRDKGSDWAKAKTVGVPYVGELLEKGSKGIGPAVGAQLGMMGVDDVVYDDTPLNRGNYSVGDYLAAAGMGTFINSIGKKGITQRDRNKLAKFDDAIDKYSVYPKKIIEPGKVNTRTEGASDYFQALSDKNFIDESLNTSPEEFIINFRDRGAAVTSKPGLALSTVLNKVPDDEITKYAKKNNLTKVEAVADMANEYTDYVNDRFERLVKLRELQKKEKNIKAVKAIDELFEEARYFAPEDIDKIQQITNKLKGLKKAKEMSLFEKNLNMLPSMGGYYLTEAADRAGLLNNEGEYVVPEDNFENEEIRKSDIRRLYNDLIKKYGKSIDSTKLTPEERYIMNEYDRMK